MPSSASYHIQDKVRVSLIRHVDGHLDSAIAAGVAISFLSRPLSRMGQFRPYQRLPHGRPNPGW